MLESVEAVVHTCFDKHFAAAVAGRLVVVAAAVAADHIPGDHKYAAAEASVGVGDGLAGHRTGCSPSDSQG